jgi:RNA polymerase sigma-70 factor, ECF subfamily
MTTQITQESDFAQVAERYRPQLRVHCYRMLGSLEEAEDLVQETYLRAWRRRESFGGRSSVKNWLYRIATNACLDALERRPRSPRTDPSGATEIPWLEPFPERLLDEVEAATDAEPDAALVSKETIELTYMFAIQHLPPKQRAVLILREVLEWSAKETASELDTSVAAVNSALQRARATLKQHVPERRLEWAPGTDPTREERALLDRYLEATERSDANGFAELIREDARWSMPPEPGVWIGRDEMIDAWASGGAFEIDTFGRMRGVVTRANRQPAVAAYRKRPGETEYEPLAIDVLTIEDGRIAEIVSFTSRFFPAFGLPEKLT